MNISIVIPVYNENERLEAVLEELNTYFEVIIIDDKSEIPVADYIRRDRYRNVKILTNDCNIGYIGSIKRGIASASGDVIVTMDGDGEHRPIDIPRLVQPIVDNKCDIVFGKRPQIARQSEIFLLKLAKLLTGETVDDAGTGFRAMRSNNAKTLEFYGVCTCGMLLMEAHDKKMRICEVSVELPSVRKPRKIAWEHSRQFLYMLSYFLKKRVHSLKDY